MRTVLKKLFASIQSPGALLIFIVIPAACKRHDELPPTVFIQSPTVSALYNFGETIDIKAAISDDFKIESVAVRIVKSNNAVVLATQHFNGNGVTEMLVETAIEFDDVHLPSGTYHVVVTASDGENEKSAFREIHLNEAPLTLTEILVVRKPSSNTTQVDSLNAGMEWSQAFSLPIGYSVGAVNSYHQSLSFAGFDYDGITTLDATSFQTLNAVATPFDLDDELFTCTATDQHDHQLYFGSADGKIRAIDEAGNESKTFTVSENFVPRIIAASAERLLVYSEFLAQKLVEVFNKDNGVFLQSVAVDAESMVALIEKNTGTDFWLIGNTGGDAMLWEYQVDANLIDVQSMPLQSGEPALQACDSPTGIYVSFPNTTRYYSENTTLLFSGSEGPSLETLKLQYDPVNDILMALEENWLHFLNGNASAIVTSINTPADVVDLMLLYNK